MGELSDQLSDLIQAANQARTKAHAPYSGFAVGAALLTKSGQVFAGCNVENISLRLTLCAEEVAVGSAVVAGETQFAAIAVTADSNDPVMPCGACRQLLAEFNPDLEVISVAAAGKVERYRLGELLPRAKQGILQDSDDV
jgi:cytidine deaminase